MPPREKVYESYSRTLFFLLGLWDATVQRVWRTSLLDMRTFGRTGIDAAYDEASFLWETIKDSGYLGQLGKQWLTRIFLWWSATGAESDSQRGCSRLDPIALEWSKTPRQSMTHDSQYLREEHVMDLSPNSSGEGCPTTSAWYPPL